MAKRKIAKSAREFDKRFDAGEDIHDLVDMSKASVISHGKKVRITLDVAESHSNFIFQLYTCCTNFEHLAINAGASQIMSLSTRIRESFAISRPRTWGRNTRRL